MKPENQPNELNKVWTLLLLELALQEPLLPGDWQQAD